MVETPRLFEKRPSRWNQALTTGAGMLVVVLLIFALMAPVALIIDGLPLGIVPVPVWVVLSVVAIIGKWVAFRWGHYRLSEAFSIGAVLGLIVPVEALFGVIHGHIWFEVVAAVLVVGGLALLLGGPPRPVSAPEAPADKR